MRRPSVMALALVVCVGASRAAPASARQGGGVRERDWRTGEYDLGNGRFTFVRGHHTELMGDGMCSVCLNIREVTFGDVDGDGRDEAILSIATSLGGAGTSLDAYVFSLVDGQPVLRAQIEGGDRGDGGLQSVSVVSGEVIVRRFDLGPHDNACCASRVLIERWRWRGGTLVKEPGRPRVERRKPRRWSMRP